MPRPERQLEDAMYAEVIDEVLSSCRIDVYNATLTDTLVGRVGVLCIIQRPYVCVQVEYDDERTTVGFSKVMHPDRWDEERGIKIAVRRAIRALFKSPA